MKDQYHSLLAGPSHTDQWDAGFHRLVLLSTIHAPLPCAVAFHVSFVDRMVSVVLGALLTVEYSNYSLELWTARLVITLRKREEVLLAWSNQLSAHRPAH